MGFRRWVRDKFRGPEYQKPPPGHVTVVDSTTRESSNEFRHWAVVIERRIWCILKEEQFYRAALWRLSIGRLGPSDLDDWKKRAARGDRPYEGYWQHVYTLKEDSGMRIFLREFINNMSGPQYETQVLKNFAVIRDVFSDEEVLEIFPRLPSHILRLVETSNVAREAFEKVIRQENPAAAISDFEHAASLSRAIAANPELDPPIRLRWLGNMNLFDGMAAFCKGVVQEQESYFEDASSFFTGAIDGEIQGIHIPHIISEATASVYENGEEAKDLWNQVKALLEGEQRRSIALTAVLKLLEILVAKDPKRYELIGEVVLKDAAAAEAELEAAEADPQRMTSMVRHREVFLAELDKVGEKVSEVEEA